MHFIILDLEATCWQGNAMDRRQEIIELAAYRVNGYREWEDDFQRFVKPTDHPRLSAYCSDLTGITQSQVDKAKRFDHVIHQFQEWLEAVDGQQLLCVWGDKDIEIITGECDRHDIPLDFLPRHINLKAQYAQIHRLSRESGLLKALEHYEIDFEGSPHRAKDDAFNTAKLFLHLMDRWQY